MDTTWFKSIHGLELWAILLKTQFLTFLEANYPHIYKPDDGPLADAFVVDMTAYTLALMESHSENKPEVHPLAYYVKKYYADIIRNAVGSEKPTHDDYDFILRKYTSLLKSLRKQYTIDYMAHKGAGYNRAGFLHMDTIGVKKEKFDSYPITESQFIDLYMMKESPVLKKIPTKKITSKKANKDEYLISLSALGNYLDDLRRVIGRVIDKSNDNNRIAAFTSIHGLERHYHLRAALHFAKETASQKINSRSPAFQKQIRQVLANRYIPDPERGRILPENCLFYVQDALLPQILAASSSDTYNMDIMAPILSAQNGIMNECSLMNFQQLVSPAVQNDFTQNYLQEYRSHLDVQISTNAESRAFRSILDCLVRNPYQA